MVSNTPNTIAIIPARGGSKGIPRKNVIDFCGKPLIAWSIEQANESESISSVYVSSEDKEILQISEESGAKLITRPEVLATDTSPSEDSLLHALEHIREVAGQTMDVMVLLQPTSPVRTAKDIDEAINLFFSSGADSLFSAAVLDDFCVWQEKEGELKSITYDYENRGRRQDRKPHYLENGSIYVFRTEVLERYHNRLGGRIVLYPMPMWKSYDIDTPEDKEICEYYMKTRHLDSNSGI